MSSSNKDLKALDALNAERAADDANKANRETLATKDRVRIEQLKARVAELLERERATVREDLIAAQTESQERPMPSDILALAKDALVARLEGLVKQHPALALQFRDLVDLSEDDLRRLLADLEEQLAAST